MITEFCRLVWYGAKVGLQGVDMEKILSCQEVFELTRDMLSPGDMDQIGPYHPEDDAWSR